MLQVTWVSLFWASLLPMAAWAQDEVHVIQLPHWSGWARVVLGADPEVEISLDGTQVDHRGPARFDLALRAGTFDPRFSAPDLPEALRGRPDGRNWIVQWWTPFVPAYGEALEGIGVRSVGYLPYQASLVVASPEQLPALRALPAVRAVVPYAPGYRAGDDLLNRALRFSNSEALVWIDLLTVRRGAEGQAPIVAWTQAAGGRVRRASPETHLLQLEVPSRALLPLLQNDGVLWIDFGSPLEADMDLVRSFHGATAVESSVGANGAGIRGEIYDLGCQVTHQEFQFPILNGPVGLNAHGTSTAAIVFGRGLNTQARGLCHAGTAIIGDATSHGGSRYGHTQAAASSTGSMRAQFLSASIGSAVTTNYTALSYDLDLIVFDLSLPHFQSQSNTGTQASRPEAWSKNVLSVGGLYHQGTAAPGDDAWSNGASVGPASDGRQKPDLAGFYDGIFTATTGSTYTSIFGGTSAATPIVAGCGGLFLDLWHRGVFGNATGFTPFDSKPKEALTRAMLLASATPWEFLGMSDERRVTRQGRGYPDLQKLWDQRNRVMTVDETDVLAPLQTREWLIEVTAGAPELSIALVWSDPPANPAAAFHRVNDLDLKVTSPTGVPYRGNGGFGLTPWSAAGESVDQINTVETLRIPFPTTGTWRISVRASGVNVDGHAETPSLDVDYALAVLGGTLRTGSAFDLLVSTGGAAIGNGSLALTAIPPGTASGYCLLSLAATGTVGTGPVAGLVPDAATLACLAEPMAVGNPLHWVWPTPANVFPASPLNLPPGSLSFTVGARLDVLGVALGTQGQVLGLTPVRRLTF